MTFLLKKARYAARERSHDCPCWHRLPCQAPPPMALNDCLVPVCSWCCCFVSQHVFPFVCLWHRDGRLVSRRCITAALSPPLVSLHVSPLVCLCDQRFGSPLLPCLFTCLPNCLKEEHVFLVGSVSYLVSRRTNQKNRLPSKRASSFHFSPLATSLRLSFFTFHAIFFILLSFFCSTIPSFSSSTASTVLETPHIPAAFHHSQQWPRNANCWKNFQLVHREAGRGLGGKGAVSPP